MTVGERRGRAPDSDSKQVAAENESDGDPATAKAGSEGKKRESRPRLSLASDIAARYSLDLTFILEII